jgi:hypothetical protein
LHASDLAAFAGRHKYRPKEECLLQYLKTISPAAYARQGRVLREERGQALLEKVMVEVPSIAACIQDASAVCTDAASTNSDARAAADRTLDSLDSTVAVGLNLGKEDQELLKERCQSKIYTEFGTHKEAYVADVVREQNKGMKLHKDDVYRKRFLFDFCCAYDDAPFKVRVFVGGKCDGVLADHGVGPTKIVEIKNRMKRLFNGVPEYERIQVLAYLFIHGLRDGVLIENYNGQTKHHAVEFDEEFWNRVTSDIRAGFAELNEMMRVHSSACQ